MLCGLAVLNLSCKQTQHLTVYQCEGGTAVRTDGGELAGMDPFTEDGQPDTAQFKDLEESWTVTRRFQVEADSDLDRLLNYKAIPSSEQSRVIPMSPYLGALVFEDDSGRGTVIAAMKTDRETIRLSGGRHKGASLFVVGNEEFNDLRYIADKALAAKLLTMIKRRDKS
jgi:hypothetical protein